MRKAGIHNFPAIDRVVYGKAASEALNDEAVRLDAKRVFLIVSRTLNTKTDEIEKIRRALGERHVATFDGIAEHTTRKQAAEVARQAKDAGADLVVAVGGGSAIDLAKIVIMAMEHDIRDEAGFDPFPMGPGVTVSPFRSPKVRQIAVPSTLNGGEYNAAALVTDERSRLKQIFFHSLMMPVAIILDPALTVHTPSKLWMGSGTRSMDHGIEALCSPAGTPLSDEVVLAGIRTLREGMQRTLQQPDDLEARRLSQYGAWLAAFGLQARVPMGASHGIGHVLGGTFGVPHYYCTPVIMPSLLRYNKAFTEDAQTRLAAALGEPGMEAAAAFAEFTRRLGLPGRLADVGIGEDNFEQISKIAINHRFVQANPRPFKSEADIVDLLRMAA
ncbi:MULTISPECIES: iron-containing alcohol dehydrogenase [unclassified Bradyrhizobium]|jgi:maleylacetate reductase|uniref:iron-containing alcohol dehydrogenase n=1 Tax=Bradyrhizobium TaxID=374 RepID=UPI00037E74D3|nr:MULTISPECIES: iron-containing alcohol dehydrogenase [unclassified Bradyrhizobium]MCK1270760.1 iron-containing alcohol dehydrogenase [Bradyrhizobium sp. 84]MCK1324003.1 iron-containing alcohol dehydrogenase [Bradyrhizobium sp. 156]MCK1332705.1 iron-containing alcohol dehydrogenase [Bradyrhizobium sp. CW9]MCK1349765.1 iron-containing alcohol dehydrogenase [Bradyrhizobium sp. CW7]MCK1372200.1 iron-containing alcohol dehydrogenase [Bradyrhizobium sp. 49]